MVRTASEAVAALYPSGQKGQKVYTGEVALDGSNPTPVTTGLKVVTAAFVCRKDATAPGAGPHNLSVDFGGSLVGGLLNIYAWEATATADTAEVASTSTDVVSWIAVCS